MPVRMRGGDGATRRHGEKEVVDAGCGGHAPNLRSAAAGVAFAYDGHGGTQPPTNEPQLQLNAFSRMQTDPVPVTASHWASEVHSMLQPEASPQTVPPSNRE